MTTKANGPLLEDFNRAIKAAKKAGWKTVTIKYPDGTEIAIREDDVTSTPVLRIVPQRLKLDW